MITILLHIRQQMCLSRNIGMLWGMGWRMQPHSCCHGEGGDSPAMDGRLYEPHPEVSSSYKPKDRSMCGKSWCVSCSPWITIVCIYDSVRWESSVKLTLSVSVLSKAGFEYRSSSACIPSPLPQYTSFYYSNLNCWLNVPSPSPGSLPWLPPPKW